MKATFKPGIMYALLAVPLGIAVVIFYGYSSLFVAHARLNAALPWVWLGVTVLMIAACVARMHFMKDPKASFSTHALLFIGISIGMGFLAREAISGAASLLNPFGAGQRIQCFVLVSIQPTPSGNVRRVMNADIRLPGEGAQRARHVQYTPLSADLSQLKNGDDFELRVLDGAFGYTALRGQRPGAGCGGQASTGR